MKRDLLLILLTLVAPMTFAQTYQQTNLELDSEIPKDKSIVCEASTSIRLLNGLRCNPDAGKSVVFRIDRFGVFPPGEGLVGGPPSSDQNGVVGALPGELQVNDIGAAVYSIPVMMPKGIGDMTPKIAVTYNNQVGNGLLGWGWNLSGLSSITRVGRTIYHDGKATPVNLTDDRFALDGNRLMLCSGNYGGNGSVYKTEIDEMSRIVAYKDGYNGPARFIVQKKDGTVWEYGCTDDSRIETQKNSKIVLTWLVNRITDPNGNAIVFNYYENQNTGEYYINNIDYTLNDDAAIQSMFRVEFNYIDRSDSDFGFVYANVVQAKKLLKNIVVRNMTSGSVMYDYSFDYIEPGNYSNDVKFMYYRLNSIGLTANGMKINSTKIAWNKSRHYPEKFLSYPLDKGVFNKVPFAGDFNGDGYSDVLTVPYKTGNCYNNNVSASVFLNDGNGSFDKNPYHTFTFDKTLEWVYVVDFDGDGRDDVVAYYLNNDDREGWKSKVVALMNRGGTFSNAGTFVSDKLFTIYPGDFCGDDRVSFFLDYYNGGFAGLFYPLILYYKNGALKNQSLGQEAYENRPERIVVEDVNGDGCSEIIYLLSNSSIINRLTYSNGVYSFAALINDNNLDSDDYLFPGDFNGDGITDFLRYDNRSYWKIIYSDGKKFKTPVSCMNNNLLNGLQLVPQDRYYCSLENLSMPSVTIRTADFDGDGKADVGVFKNSGGNYYAEIGFKVYKPSENTCDFSDIRRFYLNMNYSHQYVHVGNFLGHENASILSSVRANPFAAEVPKIVSLNPHSAKFSVERITDGLGNTHGFKYEYIMPHKNNGFYTFDYQIVNNDIRAVSVPVRALFADTVFSANNNPCVTKYYYKNALYHPKGHGLLGFERTETKLYINNIINNAKILEKDAIMMGDNCILLTNSASKYNNNNLVLSEEYYYDKYQCNQNSKVIMPLLTKKKRMFYDCDAIVKTNIENIEYQSDMSGNTYENIVNVDKYISGFDSNYCGYDASACSYKTTTEYEYNNNVSSWVVSRPSSVRYSNSYDDNDDVGYCEIYNYYGNNMYQLTRKTSLPNADMNYADPLKIVADYSYDAVGNVVMQSLVSPSSRNQRVKRFEFGDEYKHRLPTMTVNENGWATDISYENDYENSMTTVDYNGFAMEYDSDPFEIIVDKSMPGGMRSIRAKRWANDNKHAPYDAMYYYWEKTSGQAESLAFYNKKGKKLRDVTFGLNGEAVYVDLTYDDKGNITSKSMPYVAGDDKKCYFYVYDSDDRLVEEVCPNGLVKSYSYDKLQTTITTTSPNGVSQTVVETVNPVGWRTQTVDIGGNVINYEYFSDGKLKSAMLGDNVGTKVEYEYDNRRNVSKMKDPACGEVSYEYDAFGDLVETRTPRRCVTTYSYDNMGNILTRVEAGEKGENAISTQWVYDTKKGKVGTLSSVVYGDYHAVTYNYDDLLRISDITETIDGNDYTTSYSYDNADREVLVVYPSGVSVQKNYSNSGFYKSMSDPEDEKLLWQTETVNAMGYIVDYQVGNGLQTTRTYEENSNMLSGISTKTADKVYQDLSYSHDGFGNLVKRKKKTGISHSENFAYDNFNRLVEIKKDNIVTGGMTYDNYGNIISKNSGGQDVFYDAQYDGVNPYAVSKVMIDNEEMYGTNQSVDYTVFDKISQIIYGNNSLSIDYGYHHNRVHSSVAVGASKKEKIYVGDCEFVDENGKKFVYTYLKGPMGVFAVCKTDENGCKSMYFIHKDHLESWCLVTNEAGSVVQDVSFDAWGNPRDSYSWSGTYNGELFCDRGFTGHEHLTGFGVINMNGRAYDPMLSMMLSPDENIQNPDFSQNYNRYSYCYNNPLSYSDPSGEWVEWLLYGLYNGVVNIICNMDYIDGFEEAALAFGAGFVGGCLTQGLSGCSWGLQVAGKVSGAVLETGANNIVKQNTDDNLDWSLLEDSGFKEDVMYSLGSSLAKSVLSSYITQPTDTEEGRSIGSMLCGNKASQTIVEAAAGKVAGNIFAGKKMLDDVDISWSKVIPMVQKAIGVVSNGLEFECRSEALGNLFDKLLNFDSQAVLSDFGYDMNCCYSHIRSFLKLR